MGKIKLSKQEKHLVANILKGHLAGLEARLSYFKFLDTYDEEQFPEELEDRIQYEIDLLKGVLPKIDNNIKDDEDF